ncbi:hypothetical protein AAG570_008432 [Ranatra chinensis]|uniref:Cilia- and flagella-associated protein 61 N-terminal domain-containing protein n=1 Tax=Ranatra chinensis TaxID=642074 RepID=A0ABD0ZC28_9HEMI
MAISRNRFGPTNSQQETIDHGKYIISHNNLRRLTEQVPRSEAVAGAGAGALLLKWVVGSYQKYTRDGSGSENDSSTEDKPPEIDEEDAEGGSQIQDVVGEETEEINVSSIQETLPSSDYKEYETPGIGSCRRATQNDIASILNLIKEETRAFFGDGTNIGRLIENAHMSFSLYSDNDDLISFVSLCDYPNLVLPPAHWEEWLRRKFNYEDVYNLTNMIKCFKKRLISIYGEDLVLDIFDLFGNEKIGIVGQDETDIANTEVCAMFFDVMIREAVNYQTNFLGSRLPEPRSSPSIQMEGNTNSEHYDYDDDYDIDALRDFTISTMMLNLPTNEEDDVIVTDLPIPKTQLDWSHHFKERYSIAVTTCGDRYKYTSNRARFLNLLKAFQDNVHTNAGCRLSLKILPTWEAKPQFDTTQSTLEDLALLKRNQIMSLAGLMHWVPVSPRRLPIYSKALRSRLPPYHDNPHNPFGLFYINTRICSTMKILCNFRIVIVGSGDTTLGFLEHLIFSPTSVHRGYGNIVLICDRGLPPGELFEEESWARLRRSMLVERGRYQRHYLQSLALHAWVTVVRGRMTAIDRKEKLVVVEGGEGAVRYDYLFLFCGKQFGKPPAPPKGVTPLAHCRMEFEKNPDLDSFLEELPKNMFVINNEFEAEDALRTLRVLMLKREEGQLIVVYGHSLNALACINCLRKFGLPSSYLVYVEPFPVGRFAIDLFNNPTVSDLK